MILTKNIFIYVIVASIAAVIGIFYNNFVYDLSLPIIICILSLPLLIVSILKSQILPVLLLISIMFTEFYWLEVMEGYLKPFHIVSVILFMIFSIFHLKPLKASKILQFFVVFLFILFNQYCLFTRLERLFKKFYPPSNSFFYICKYCYCTIHQKNKR